MKLKRELPPNYEEIVKTLSPSDKAVFTYGDTLYIPQDIDMSRVEDHLLVHEEVHGKQQQDPVAWWNRYLADADFRMDQELEAYATQYAFVCKKNIMAKQKKSFLERIAADLASPMYGSVLTQPEAESKIRNRAKEIDVDAILADPTPTNGLITIDEASDVPESVYSESEKPVV